MTDPILYETSMPGIARIILNRPATRNAQDTAFLYALNEQSRSMKRLRGRASVNS